MKIQTINIALALVIVFGFSSCQKGLNNDTKKGDFNRSPKALFPDTHTLPNPTGTISGVISTNITLTNDKVWFIDGPTFVTNNAVVTIQPGTYIKGLKSLHTTSGLPSYLIFSRGSKIDAQGTTVDPIVFTSAEPVGHRDRGDWGGLALLGSAPVNQGFVLPGVRPSEIPASIAGQNPTGYGGTSESDNSGIVKNVRIEFGGLITDPTYDGSLNGLMLAGVGAGTIIDHVQVSYSLADGFSLLGGSVNMKYLIAYGNMDDDLDFDQGYQGSIQFAIAAKDLSQSTSSSPNGIESNNSSAPFSAPLSPRLTQPILSNITFIGGPTAGPTGGIGHLFRVNSSYRVRNSIVMGYNSGALLIATTGSEYSNSYVHGFSNAVSGSASLSTAVTLLTGANPNTTIRLVNPFSATSPDWRIFPPTPAGIRLGANFTGLTVTHPGGTFTSFDTTPTYLGAFGMQNLPGTRWDAGGWASYEPYTNPY